MAKDKEIESDDWDDELDLDSEEYDEFMDSLDDTSAIELTPRHRFNAARALEIRREQRWLDRELSDWDLDDDVIVR